MNLADQISAKRAQIGQIESNISSCERGLSHLQIGEDTIVFARYQSVRGWQSGTVMLSADVAEAAINAQLELLKIEIDKAEQELQILINSQPK